MVNIDQYKVFLGLETKLQKKYLKNHEVYVFFYQIFLKSVKIPLKVDNFTKFRET